ncbi:MAG: phosphoribosylformylglycinamidine synthase subunit PurL [Deltaproteobacteria bacterium]|jgi:phosphoribosylformylglycinamidine synthase|nr:phosphoribosylformylglycinamidine synthase subunit PurL [Deltaproteobacteria bacterium]
MSRQDAPWSEHGLTEEEFNKIESLMGRSPNYLELAIFGVMWSEHCGYKNSKAHLKKFPTTGPMVLQGPGENAGVVDLGDGLAAAFKMESHNHPSAIEPYQGAATGVGGIIRDIFAMGARPIASLNSLRFGEISDNRVKRLLNGVVAGIGGYGNCMGIPTVGGDLYFHPSYRGNPLVNAMCLGLMKNDRIFRGQAVGHGNIVMLVGARTGRDGIKGASFASVELSDKDPDKRPNVQVGDPFMEKLLMEATLEILERNLVVGLQDLGAAGLTSSGAEMAGRAGNGISIDLDLVPLREAALADWEIMLSESQERMLLVVEPKNRPEIEAIFDKWDLSAAAIGEVTSDGIFRIHRSGKVLAEIAARFLTDEVPIYIRPYREPSYHQILKMADVSLLSRDIDLSKTLRRLLASPNICSRNWVYEQYDHMVGLATIIRPGGDAALLRLPESKRGLALSSDCNSRYVYLDPYLGGAIAVAEAALNVAVVGAKPLALTNCLNFGNPENPEIYWQFVLATDGLAEAARVLGTPVTGGNVSFYNEFDGRAIFPTPTIGMIGVIEDIDLRLTHGFKNVGDLIVLIGKSKEELGASEFHHLMTGRDEGVVPSLDLEKAAKLNDFLVVAASKKLLLSAHDCAEGGLAVALFECAQASGGLGVEIKFSGQISTAAALFGESQSRVVVSLSPDKLNDLTELLTEHGLEHSLLGQVTNDDRFHVIYNDDSLIDLVHDLALTWSATLPREASI